MNRDTKKYNISKEHEEMGKDIINVILSYTPISGILDTTKFIHKWAVKRKGVRRIAKHVKSKYNKNKVKN